MAKQLGSDQGKPGDDDKDRQKEIGGNLSQDAFLESCAEMAELRREQKALAAKVSTARKKIKARGVELGLMDAALKMAEWDRDEVRSNWETRRRYAEWLGLPIGAQGDMFKDMSAEDKARHEAHARGVTDKRAGGTGQPPEDLDAAYHDAYLRGFGGKKLEGKAKGPKTNGEGKVVAPEHGQGHDPDFDGDKKKAPVPTDSEAALQ